MESTDSYLEQAKHPSLGEECGAGSEDGFSLE